QQELMFPEETLATYLRFITNAPSPSGFQQTTVKPTAPGPSALTQIGSTAAGIGTLLGGVGKSGLFNQGGAVGRRAGLSGIVRRNTGGQIVRMNNGGGFSQSNFMKASGSGAKFIQNLLDFEGIFEDRSKAMGKVSGDVLEPEPSIIPQFAEREAGEYLYPSPVTAVYDPNMELVAGLNPDQIKTMMPTKSTAQETVIEEETAPAPDTEPQEKQQTLAERYAEYKKLMEGDDTESELSWPERLQMAAAFFGAADSPSTGSFLGDLAQFGKDTTPGVAKALAARDKRELAAKKRRIQSVKDFRAFIREEQLRPLEIAKLAADLGYTQAQTNKLISEYTNPEVASPGEVDIAGAISYLDYMGIPVRETSKEKGKYGKAGSAYQLAQVAKSLKTSADNALRIAKERGAVAEDPDGRLIIDVDKAIRGGSRRVDQPVRGVTRGADGKLVAKAEGGMVGDKPVLRYPEDFS
ncbi:MAG: hypothetical protein ACO3M2_11200, partial [Pseudohongiellaceae bacterium]